MIRQFRSSIACFCLALTPAFAIPSPAFAGKGVAIREAVKHVFRRGGAESVEQLTRRAGTLASRYGNDGLRAFKKVGANSLKLAEDAGHLGDDAIRLMSRHGHAALGVVRHPTQLALVSQYGDDAAIALVKHGQIVGPIIGQFGKQGAKVAAHLTGQNARRLAMMTGDKSMNPKLFQAITNHGDAAMNFIFRNKMALATSAGLLAFVSNPEVFLNGSVDLADAVAGHAVAPIANSINGTLVAVLCVAVFAIWLWRRSAGRTLVVAAS